MTLSDLQGHFISYCKPLQIQHHGMLTMRTDVYEIMLYVNAITELKDSWRPLQSRKPTLNKW